MCLLHLHEIKLNLELYKDEPPLKLGGRLDSEGNRIFKEIPFIQSEGVVQVAMEYKFCEEVKFNGYFHNPSKGKYRLAGGGNGVQMKGGSMSGESIQMSSEAKDLMNKLCIKFWEDHWEGMEQVFREGDYKDAIPNYCKKNVWDGCDNLDDIGEDGISGSYERKQRKRRKSRDEL